MVILSTIALLASTELLRANDLLVRRVPTEHSMEKGLLAAVPPDDVEGAVFLGDDRQGRHRDRVVVLGEPTADELACALRPVALVYPKLLDRDVLNLRAHVRRFPRLRLEVEGQ